MTSTDSELTETPSTRTGRGATIALWVLQVLLAAMFLFSGAGKLAGTEQMVELFDKIGFGQWFRYVTGGLEVAGAIGLLIPRLSGLAALGLAGVMVGAVITEAFLSGVVLLPLVLLVLAAIVARGRRDTIGRLWPRTRKGA
jgi:uncharacterized membrane protein YphA (DoxX/SURF4 family)